MTATTTLRRPLKRLRRGEPDHAAIDAQAFMRAATEAQGLGAGALLEFTHGRPGWPDHLDGPWHARALEAWLERRQVEIRAGLILQAHDDARRRFGERARREVASAHGLRARDLTPAVAQDLLDAARERLDALGRPEVRYDPDPAARLGARDAEAAARVQYSLLSTYLHEAGLLGGDA